MTPLKVEQLRRQHPRFIYNSFTVERAGEDLKLRYHFTIEPDLQFAPETVIEAADWDRINALSPGLLELLVFHLGLVEMLSYWKATCSPELLVQAGSLDPQQLDWWTDLLLYGMREFFYVNQIDFTKPGFLHISSSAPRTQYTSLVDKHDNNEECHSEPEQGGGEESRFPSKKTRDSSAFGLRMTNPQNLDSGQLGVDSVLPDHDLVLMSGGKDSALSVQLLRELGREFHCLLLNPTPAAEAITAQVGDRAPIIVRRTIDPRLLALNQAGYLNGHTPFSAYLAMLGVTCAVLFDYRRVIVANERSADEGNVEFLGSEVNHQYSKTLRFESAFRWYSQTYLVRDVEYFSLLRPLYEVQIARLFVRYPQYFSSFTSCNRKQKEGSWCKQCSKCLSTFTLLYPFLSAAEVTRIFGEDLFERAEAIPTIRELLGFTEHKPFECVGTREEMLVALYLSIQRAKAHSSTLPVVLRYIEADIVPLHPEFSQRVKNILQAWSEEHHLPPEYADLLREQLES